MNKIEEIMGEEDKQIFWFFWFLMLAIFIGIIGIIGGLIYFVRLWI